MSSDRASLGGVCPPITAASTLYRAVDGTLRDIAASPDRVVVPPSLVRDLEHASAALGGALALVSGRAIASIDRVFAPLRLPAAGQHGAEIRYAQDGPIVAAALPDLAILRRLLAPVTAITGVEIEDKGRSLAVHYRRARTDARELRRWVAEAVARAGAAVEIIRGRRVLELKPRGVSKATAVDGFMAAPPFLGRWPIFVGDDKTDEDGFRAATARGGLAVQVGPNRSALTELRLSTPAAVRRWLAAFPAALREVSEDAEAADG